MKILWLTPTRQVPWIIELAKLIKEEENLELTILNFNGRVKDKINIEHRDDVEYIVLKIPRGKLNLLTLYRRKINILKCFLAKEHHKYDLIHIFGTEHIHHVASYNFDIPQVLMPQGIMSEYKKFIYEFDWRVVTWRLAAYYELRYLNKIRNFTYCTHWEKAFLDKVTGDSRRFLIWNMIRPEFFAITRKPEFVSKDILFVGGTEKRKGLKELLHAIQLIGAEWKPRIHVAGKSDPKVIEQILKNNNLTNVSMDQLNLIGHINSELMVELMSKSFCLVHPTHIDNWPNVVSESQITGLPVIASDVGGVASQIEDGKTGMLYKSLDIKMLADKILTLRNSEEIWNTISENGSKVARERHNPQKIVGQTMDMYDLLIREKIQ